MCRSSRQTPAKRGIFGWSGVMRAAGVIFFAYIGFDAVSTAAQEAKNPQRDMPIGIIGSLAVCTVLYVVFAYVLTGIVNYKNMTDTAIYEALHNIGYDWLGTGVVIGILAGYTSVILVMLLGQSRVFYSMSRDGLLPKLFSDIHPKLPDALALQSGFHGFRQPVLRPRPALEPRQHDQHRHPPGFRHRVRRRHDHAQNQSRSASAL